MNCRAGDRISAGGDRFWHGGAADMGDAAIGVVDDVNARVRGSLKTPPLGRERMGLGAEELLKEALDGLGFEDSHKGY
jgi:hypothetical protein